MKTELLQKVLEGETGVRVDGKSYAIGDELDLSIHIEMGHEAMAIPRVRKITVAADVLVLETHKNERIYIGADTGIKALKFAPNEAGRKASTGFAGQR